MPKTVVGMFDTFSDAQACVADLERNGFTENDISVLASQEARRLDTGDTAVERGNSAGPGAATGATIGIVGGGAIGLLAGLGLFAIPGFGPVLAAGPLIATLTGAAIGGVAGGIIGALAGMGVPREEAEVYAEGVRRGATLVTLQTDYDEMADRAADIMNRHNAVDIDQRGASYRQAGFTHYNPNASPYTAEEIQRERAQYARPAPSVMAGGAPAPLANAGSTDRPPIQELRSSVPPAPPIQPESQTASQPVAQTAAQPFREGASYVTGGTRVRTYDTAGPIQQRAQAGEPETADDWDADFRNHWQSTYATVVRYEDYEPAYQYGYNLSRDPRYANRPWEQIEPGARSYWESQQPGAWQRFKDAVRYGWERGRVGDVGQRAA